MMNAWGDVWKEDYQLKMQRDPTKIAFNQQNPFMEQSNDQSIDLLAQARELVEQGKMQEILPTASWTLRLVRGGERGASNA